MTSGAPSSSSGYQWLLQFGMDHAYFLKVRAFQCHTSCAQASILQNVLSFTLKVGEIS
jgi:hypothetical protein